MKDVFISYSRADYVDENKNVRPDSIVLKIKHLLEKNGISYWMDEEGIYYGDDFAKIIVKNIKDSHIFLFISTANSNASIWTSKEIATAQMYKKKIIPLRYDSSMYDDSVILFLANLDYMDYVSNPDLAMNKLIMTIKEYLKHIEDSEYARTAARQEEEKRQKQKQLGETIRSLEHQKEEKTIELRVLEKKITDLKTELAALVGCDNVPAEVSIGEENSERKAFLFKDNTKHKLAVYVYSLIAICSALWGSFAIGFCLIEGFDWDPASHALLSFPLALASFGILKNKVAGLVGMILVEALMAVFFDNDFYTVLTILIICSIIPLFLKKDGVPAWKTITGKL